MSFRYPNHFYSIGDAYSRPELIEEESLLDELYEEFGELDYSREYNPGKPKTPEERAAAVERERKRRAAMTPEQRAARNEQERLRIAAMDPEKKALVKARNAENQRRHKANMTPEEKERNRKLNQQRSRERYDRLTPEQKAAELEKQKRQRESMTPEQREAYLAYHRNRKNKITPEEREERTALRRARREAMTPEERSAYREYYRNYKRNRLAAMTPEQKAAYNENQRQYYLRMTPEEKAIYLDKKRAYYADMSPEEREKFREKNRKGWYSKLETMSAEELYLYRRAAAERTRKRYANMTPEQKAAKREYNKQRYLSMTPEERAAANQRQRERRAAIRERLERARLGVLAYFTRKEIDQMREEERARRENMTEEERAEERDAFRDRLHSIGFGAPDFEGLERLREHELRAMAAFIASQRGTRYEEIMEDEEEEETEELEEGRDSEDFDSEDFDSEDFDSEDFDSEDFDAEDFDDDSREDNPSKPKTPEQRAAKAEYDRQRHLSFTPEQRSDYLEGKRQKRLRKLAAMPTEEREALREHERNRRAAMTPEERKADNEIKYRSFRRKLDAMSPEEREAHKESERQRRRRFYAAMTPEQRAVYNEKQRLDHVEKYRAMTPEERAAFNENRRLRRAAMTPEEREVVNESRRIRYAAIRERLERARLGVLAYFTKKEIEQMRMEELARRESMTEEERAEERDAFRDRLNSIGFGAPDFEGLEKLREDELRAMAAFIASQRGTRYEEIMEDEEEEESSLEEDLDSEDLDDDSREDNPRKPLTPEQKAAKQSAYLKDAAQQTRPPHKPDPRVAREVKKSVESFLVSKGLPKDTPYALLAGAAMYFHGLRPELKDADIVVPGLGNKKFNEVHGKYEVDGGGNIDDLGHGLTKFTIGTRQIEHGVQFASLQATLAFKKALNREKDQADIKAIQQHMGEDDDDSREPNPRVSANRTNEALWKKIVKKITAGSKGGRPGQWSARKAQLAVAQYKEAGGGYIGKKSKDNSLHKWTVQDWRTKSGRASLETGERYLPAKAIKALSDEEYKETSRAKRAGMRTGAQFIPQPKKIARKVSKYRRNNPEIRGADGFEYDMGPGVDIDSGDFSGVDFSGMDLRGADFRNNRYDICLNFSGADFTGANLEDAKFAGANLSGAIFKDANMAGALISDCPMDGAIFEDADLRDASIRGTPLPQRGINFRGADLSGVEVSQLFIADSDFTGAKFNLNSEEVMDWVKEIRSDYTYAQAVTPGIIEVLAYAKRNNCSGLEENKDSVLNVFRAWLDHIHVEKRQRAIEAGAYIGFVEGLWIHQTDEPQFEYRGELCVSPYSDAEERFYRGGRIFGVIMDGVAELFADDVWSTVDVFGRLMPNRFEVRPEHHKEAFINGSEAHIVGLTYPKYAEEIPSCARVIEEWRSMGYITIPIVALPGRPRR